MAKDNLLCRISIAPNICHGKPCIKGHRIWVSLIPSLLAGGTTIKEILEAYPDIEREKIFACFAYGAEMTKDSYVEVSLGEKKEGDRGEVKEMKQKIKARGDLWLATPNRYCRKRLNDSLIRYLVSIPKSWITILKIACLESFS